MVDNQKYQYYFKYYRSCIYVQYIITKELKSTFFSEILHIETISLHKNIYA